MSLWRLTDMMLEDLSEQDLIAEKQTEIILETAVGHAQGCRFQFVWQGVMTRMAAPCKEEQRSQAS